MSRIVQAGNVAAGQLDFFDAGTGARVTGVIPADVTLTTFRNNVPVAWALRDGTSVPDPSISAGAVYLHEIPGANGFYAVRFFPDAVGFWRIISVRADVEQVLEFDVLPAASDSGLYASLVA